MSMVTLELTSLICVKVKQIFVNCLTETCIWLPANIYFDPNFYLSQF